MSIEYVKSQDEISEIEMAEIWLFSGIEKQMQLKQIDLEIAKLLEDCCKRHLI